MGPTQTLAQVGAEVALYHDGDPPKPVDAIAFWGVCYAEWPAIEVQDYSEVVVLPAQTAPWDSIGTHDLAELITSRQELGDGLNRRSTRLCVL